MKTIILPGFSPKNKQWAEKVKESLNNNATIHEWKHWETEDKNDFIVDEEIKKVNPELEEIHIIAKSIGTLVAVKLIKEKQKINKLILNGIPLKFISENNLSLESYNELSNFNLNNLVIFQNENDPLGNIKDLTKFISKISYKINIVSHDRSDHDYPYFDEFRQFLSNN